jgi:hypothetical protein
MPRHQEPHQAADYGDREVQALRRVLIEIEQIWGLTAPESHKRWPAKEESGKGAQLAKSKVAR